MQAPRAPAKVAILGDSNTAAAVYTDLSTGASKPRISYQGDGYATWMNVYLGQRLQFLPELNFGVFGDTSEMMLARVPDVLQANPDVVVVMGGTNDREQLWSAQRTMTALGSIYDRLLTAGVLVIAIPIIPRSIWGALTAPQITEQRLNQYRVNRWIRQRCIDLPGLVLADPAYALTDPASATADPLSGYFNADGLHTDIRAAQTIGRAVADAIGPLVAPNQTSLPSHNLDAYHATLNPTGNLLSNGGMRGTGGSVSAPATGQVADSWALFRALGSAGGTVAASKQARTDAPGDWQVLTFTGLTGGAQEVWSLRHVVFGSGGSYAAGDVIEAECEIEVSGAASLNGAMLRIREWTGSGHEADAYSPNTTTQTSYTLSSWSGIIRTPPITIEQAVGASSQLQAYIDVWLNGAAGAAATVKIGRVDVRKVIA